MKIMKKLVKKITEEFSNVRNSTLRSFYIILYFHICIFSSDLQNGKTVLENQILRFSERAEYFLEHTDSCFKELAKFKTKIIYILLCCKERDKIKEIKRKD